MVRIFSSTPDLRVTAPVDVQFTDGTAEVEEADAAALSRYMPALGLSLTEPVQPREEPPVSVSEHGGTSTDPGGLSLGGGEAE